MNEIILRTKKLQKYFGQNKVLYDINIEINKGDFTIIMGPSGAGKSTLLYSISGMDQPTKGIVLYKNKDITKYNEKEMALLRQSEFGFVFQNSHLVSNLSLKENIIVAGYKNKNKNTEERCMELLEKMKLCDAKDRLPMNASGGECSRAALARAIINKPNIIFADEPTGALNKANSLEVLDALTELNNEGETIIMVTHDPQSAIRGNRIFYIEDGQIIGEKKLAKYNPLDEKQRTESLNLWLSELKW